MVIVNTECAAIPDSERVDCGWSGITRLECEANLCCYSSSGSKPCYYKGGTHFRKTFSLLSFSTSDSSSDVLMQSKV